MEDEVVIFPDKRWIYEAFGFRWVEDKTVRSGPLHLLKSVMILDRSNPHADELKAFMEQYDALEHKRKYYEDIDFLLALLCFLLFIIPGIIYVAFKLNQKQKIEEHNYFIEIDQKKLIEKAKPLLQF
ncbi:MAG TPA: hypothetical protein PKO28_00400 [Bacilli bacterium]|nr:hypothetical protein [Bacilli bacterium]HPS19307.1 hypothetical protein [Bacilli bacterium]